MCHGAVESFFWTHICNVKVLFPMYQFWKLSVLFVQHQRAIFISSPILSFVELSNLLHCRITISIDREIIFPALIFKPILKPSFIKAFLFGEICCHQFTQMMINCWYIYVINSGGGTTLVFALFKIGLYYLKLDCKHSKI